MRLSNYNFGQIKIDGEKETSDFILHEDWKHGWWRKSGHQVVPADLEKIADRKPDKIIFGEGSSGRMGVTARARSFLEEKGIDFESYTTDKATDRFNKLEEEGADVAAAFHLTC